MGTFPNEETQFKPGQSGNPNGRPKGALSLSWHIQHMMEKADFKTYVQHPTEGYKEFAGTPMEAIVTVALTKAAAGDKDARDWLAKYGYGSKLDMTTNGKDLPTPILGGLTKNVPTDDSD